MLGLAFAVASVSLNHLLRSGIWATCTLENQETEGKGGGRERQGLKMRWREQCHSCHIFFESGCIGLASLPICIPFAKFGRGGDGSTFGQKGEGRKTAEETGSFRAATVINAPGPACSTSLDITRHYSKKCAQIFVRNRRVARCCKCGADGVASNMFWTLNPVSSFWTYQQYRLRACGSIETTGFESCNVSIKGPLLHQWWHPHIGWLHCGGTNLRRTNKSEEPRSRCFVEESGGKKWFCQQTTGFERTSATLLLQHVQPTQNASRNSKTNPLIQL